MQRPPLNDSVGHHSGLRSSAGLVDLGPLRSWGDGRYWHCAEGLRGFLVAESADAEAIAKWTQSWTDLLSFEVTPVVTDEQLARVIG